MSTRRSPVTRGLNWAVAVLLLTLGLAWATSTVLAVYWIHGKWMVGLSGGSLILSSDLPADVVQLRGIFTEEPKRRFWPILPGEYRVWGLFRETFIPLWIPLLLLGGAAGVLRWRDRRKRQPGHCCCGYDLTGNTSGVCPECGRAM